MKKISILLVLILIFTGCAQDNSSSPAGEPVEVSSVALSSIHELSDLESKAYNKSQLKFGTYTDEIATKIVKSVPLIEFDNQIVALFYDKYFNQQEAYRGIANPTSWENRDWIRTFQVNTLDRYGMYRYRLGFELTILERLDLKFDESYGFSDKSFYKARVEKAFSCDLQKGDEIIISQQGNEKVNIVTAPVSIQYYLFTPNQRITALFDNPEKAVTTDGRGVELYHTFFSFVLYNETIDGIDWALDKMDQNIVEAAYFFQKASDSSDAFKTAYPYKNNAEGLMYVGILRADVLEKVINELI